MGGGKIYVLLLIVICLLMFTFFDYLPGPIFKNQQIAKQLLFFAIGMWFREYKPYFFRARFAILLTAIVVISFYSPLLISCKIHFIDYHNWMILALATCPVIYYLSKQLYEVSFAKQVLIKWGQNSLGLYIIHVFFIRFIFTAFGFRFSTGNIYFDYVLCFIISVIISCFIMEIIRLIQRNKVTRLFFLGEVRYPKN